MSDDWQLQLCDGIPRPAGFLVAWKGVTPVIIVFEQFDPMQINLISIAADLHGQDFFFYN